MPTSYADYYTFLKANGVDVDSFLIAALPLIWANIERSFSNFYELYHDCGETGPIPIIMYPVDRDPQLITPEGSHELTIVPDFYTMASAVEEVHDRIEDWISSIQLPKRDNNFHFDESSLFITFNYTSVLEGVYHIPSESILHIHGTAGKHNLIFGYPGEPHSVDYPKDWDGFTESFDYSYFNEILLKTNKNTDKIIKDHSDFWCRLDSVDKIVIIGSSIGDDADYFEQIHKCTKERNPTWIYYQHGLDYTAVNYLLQLVGTVSIRQYPEYNPEYRFYLSC